MANPFDSYTPERLDAYITLQLRRGIEPLDLRRWLREQGLEEDRIRTGMGLAYDGRRPAEDAEPARIAAPPLVGKAADDPAIQRLATSKAQVYAWRDFLHPKVCDAVIDLIEADLRDSTTTDAFADPKVRTSSSSDIGTKGHTLIHEVDDLMSEALGIHWSYADQSQAQKYQVGQEYKAHYDYFAPGTRDYQIFCQNRGQRTWTFMVYLNDVEAGGGTRFRRLDKTFMPRKGMAVIWNNLTPGGAVNPNTIHHGMKVRTGVKYVITKWFRQRGWGEMFPS